MIAIIPCAGRGTRRRPDTDYKPKILLEHRGEPLIEHIVRPIDMSERFEKLVFVLSPKHGNQIIDYVRRNPFETPASFVWQNEPLGFGHAVLQAKEEVFSFRKWNPPVLVATDDGIRTSGHSDKSDLDFIGELVDGSVSEIGVAWTGNVREHGMVVNDGTKVELLVEKPYWDEGGLVMTGIYFIRESRRLFRCLSKLVKSGRKLGGEYQFTHALQMMIDKGTAFRTCYHQWEDGGRDGKQDVA